MAGKSGLSREPWPRCPCGSVAIWRDADLCQAHFRQRSDAFLTELEESNLPRPKVDIPDKLEFADRRDQVGTRTPRSFDELELPEIFGLAMWLAR